MPKWGPTDGAFNLAELFHIVCSLLSDRANDSWVEETMTWWHMYVFHI